MQPPLWPQLLLQVILIAINAYFAATEIAVISLNEAVIRHQAEEGDKKAARLLHIVEQPTGFLSTIQIGITLAGFLGSAFAADNLAGRLSQWFAAQYALTAAAEAAAMCRDRKRRVTLISGAAHPDVINTVRTYCYGTGDELRVVPVKDGRTDPEALRQMLAGGDVSGVYIQQPNFFGQLEEAEALGEIIHQGGALYILGVNPIAAAILKTPRDCGADVAVGEGQPLGMPLGWGGPYLGFMATVQKHMRKLPGRIVGQTVDSRGQRCFVLSLQAREQHIRREKASSNICSNEALCALTASVYMAVMGPEGMAEAARQCLSKAHYLAKALCAIPGVSLRYPGEYFHEFVTELPRVPEVLEALEQHEILAALEQADILGGLPLEGGILWCATEKVSRAVLDETAAVVKEVLSK